MKDKKKNSKRPEPIGKNQNPPPGKSAPAPIKKRAAVEQRVRANPAQKVSGDGEAKAKTAADPVKDLRERAKTAVDAGHQALPAPPEAAPDERPSATSFPIIGIGASAGGLAAFEKFFAHMPADSDTGSAFVIVQHLDPDHKSILTELVRRYTKMKVFEVQDGVKVEPNCAYIIRPNKDLALAQGKLHLMEPTMRRGMRLPIDFFFRSLAQDQGERSIGLILSGNGTDGTLGLRAIKEAGGLAMVQEPASAEFDGMPRSDSPRLYRPVIPPS